MSEWNGEKSVEEYLIAALAVQPNPLLKLITVTW